MTNPQNKKDTFNLGIISQKLPNITTHSLDVDGLVQSSVLKVKPEDLTAFLIMAKNQS